MLLFQIDVLEADRSVFYNLSQISHTFPFFLQRKGNPNQFFASQWASGWYAWLTNRGTEIQSGLLNIMQQIWWQRQNWTPGPSTLSLALLPWNVTQMGIDRSAEVRRGYQMPCTWSYTWLWPSIWVLGIKPGHLEKTSVLLTVGPSLQPRWIFKNIHICFRIFWKHAYASCTYKDFF